MKASRLGGLFALAVVTHVESLSYWFVSTDTFALIRSSRVRSGGDLAATVTEPMMHGTGFTGVALFYRPLSSLSFALDYWLWGLDPAGYHATNLLLAGLAAVLAAVVVAEVTRRPIVGLVAGGLFAVHPLTAEVVPVVARRQDVVMLVFVLASLALFVRARREGSTALSVMALLAYALALAAKEPALLLPVLVFVWAATEPGASSPLAALLEGVRATLPYAAVTAGYLAVRLAVLGGLGGYLERPSLTVADLPALLAKYVLSLGYPVDAVGVGSTVGGAWILVPVVLAVLAGVILGWAIPATARTRSARRGLPLVAVALSLGAIPAVLLLDRATLVPALATLGYVGSPGELPFPYPYHGSAAPLLGLALVAATVASVLWSALEPASPVAADRRALAFFAVWLVLPLGLFYRSGDYAVRSGFPSLVPAMALLATLLVAGLGRVDADLERSPDPVLASAVLLLVVPMIAASPLVHPYDGWAASGEVNRLTLTGLESPVADAPDGVPLRVVGIPAGIQAQRDRVPRVVSIGYLGPGSIESWFALRESLGERRVTVDGRVVLDRRPHGATVHAEREPDAVAVHVRYATAERTEASRRGHPPRNDVDGQRFASLERPWASVPIARSASR